MLENLFVSDRVGKKSQLSLEGWAVRVDSECFPSLHLTVQPSQDDDPPPSTLLKDYQNIPGTDMVDDVVQKLLTLEMANQKKKLKIK